MNLPKAQILRLLTDLLSNEVFSLELQVHLVISCMHPLHSNISTTIDMADYRMESSLRKVIVC